ncbi:RHS repeat-associated core domain-containing protein [Grimontia marina]|uniref:tRNA(Glu)-specific nuclease WapA n=1 Tax=Grimontia marina TaxID=646534 RepID=A0A128FJ34_9GAMM|nr:RHS repeat-associated core domain-containing protein [Grimontia marina]CZF86817.1 tRNA(Glu)-specific nuclease WapA precursor [Grimontia marina]
MNVISFLPAKKWVARSAAVFASLVSAIFYANAFDLDVGELKGSPSVENGMANYSLSLQVPEGINGLAPKLSVNYRQGSSNSSLGLGFYLSDFPTIERCSASKRVDGYQSGIHFNENDQYCMVGKRLVLVNGNLGQPGSEYRIAGETSTKITAIGSGTSIDAWMVYRADGYVATYRDTDTSNNTNIRWHLSEYKDRFDNKIDYTYRDSFGTTLPETISYSNVEINFSYRERSDISTAWYRGERAEQRELLDNVTVKRNGAVRQRFNFDYEQVSLKGGASYSRLVKAQLCDASNQCFPAHTFDWESTNLAESSPYLNNLLPVGDLQGYLVGDINRDARPDICILDEGIRCADNLGGGRFSSPSTTYPIFNWDSDESRATIQLIDINRDGYTDICGFNETGFYCAKNQSGRFESQALITNAFSLDTSNQFIDFDRDGFVDLCRIETTGLVCQSNSGSQSLSGLFSASEIQLTSIGWPLEKTLVNGFDAVNLPRPQLIDFNGDGNPDVCGITNDGALTCATGLGQTSGSGNIAFSEEVVWARDIPVAAFAGQGSESTYNALKKQQETLLRTYRLADLNMDGLPDVCYRQANDYVCRINTGSSLMPASKILTLPSAAFAVTDYVGTVEQSITFDDRNGDSVDDFCYIEGQRLFCAYNQSSGFSEPSLVSEIPADLVSVREREKFYGNFVRRFFGLSTTIDVLTVMSAYGPFRQVGDLDGNGTNDDCFRSVTGVSCLMYEHEPMAKLSSVTSGFGNTTTFYYGNTDSSDVFTSTGSQPAPLLSLSPQLNVVTKIESNDGIGGKTETRFAYKGYVAHEELGALGFLEITETMDLDSGERATTRKFGFDSAFRPYISEAETRVNGRKVQRALTSFREVDDPYSELPFRVTEQKKTESFDLSERLLTSVVETFSDYDAQFFAGTTTKVTIDANGGRFEEKTETNYEHNDVRWLIGKPTRIQVTKSNGTDSQTRVTQHKYDAVTGVLVEQIIEPGHDHQITHAFTYSANGLRLSAREETSLGARVEKSEYDQLGRLVRHTNAKGHSATTTYNDFCHLPASAKDSAGLTTHFTYDSFCRKVQEDYPDGNWKKWVFDWSDGANAGADVHGLTLGDRSLYLITEQTSQGSWRTTYFDRFGREVRVKTPGTNNRIILVDKAFNRDGQLAGETVPYFEGLFDGDATYWKRTDYDALGRPVRTILPTEDGADIVTNISYSGLTRTSSGSGVVKREETGNGLGQTVEIIEANSHSIRHTYDAYENLIESDVNGKVITMQYDDFGRKISMTDPAMGTWHYEYNPWGELVAQTDAKGQVTNYVYDELGRKIEERVNDDKTVWQYDASLPGQLDSNTTSDNVSHSYEYDSLKRVVASHSVVDGVRYTTRFEYDEDNRLSRVIYPSGMRLDHKYDLNGLLDQLSMPNADLWDRDFIKIEQALRETAARIVELEAQAQVYEKNAIYYTEQADKLRANADALFAQEQALDSEASTLYSSANQLMQVSLKNAALATNYRNTANYYYNVFGRRVFSFVKNQNGLAYYKYDQCVSKDWKGRCKRREYFQVAIPMWMVETRVCYTSGKYKTSTTCSMQSATQVVAGDVYSRWANHYQNIANNYRALAQQQSARADALTARADELERQANAYIAEANNYLVLAREQTDLLDIAVKEMDDLVVAQESLSTLLDDRLKDETENILWKATSRDAFGRLSGELFGNGYLQRQEIDRARGNIKSITTSLGTNQIQSLSYDYNDRNQVTQLNRNLRGQTELYEYDDLNQLVRWTFDEQSNANFQERQYRYDIYGNLTYKSNVGDIASLANGQLDGDTFKYDANGNQTQGPGRSIVWNAFNKVESLTENGETVTYTYDANKNRIKRVLEDKTTYYVGPGYEMDVEQRDGKRVLTMRHRLMVDGQAVGEHIKTLIDDEKQLDKTAYFHRDRLGNADIISDNLGVVQIRQNFTPFGETLAVQELENPPLFTRNTLRGFTAHENVGVGKLINMNARLYDPVYGRFISADTIIPEPGMSGSYNRYSYVYNNPVNFTDPSGHNPFIIFAIGLALFTFSFTTDNQFLQAITAIAGTLMMGYASFGANGLWGLAGTKGAIASGATVGFTTGVVSTGKISGGLKGAIIGGAGAGITSGIGGIAAGTFAGKVGVTIAHGVTQGIIAEAKGGKFRNGFIGGLVAKAGGLAFGIPDAIELQMLQGAAFAAAAVLLTGGDGQDAFVQAAAAVVAVYLYNDLSHKPDEGGQSYADRAKIYRAMQARIDDAGIDTVWFGVAADLNDHFSKWYVRWGLPDHVNDLGIELLEKNRATFNEVMSGSIGKSGIALDNFLVVREQMYVQDFYQKTQVAMWENVVINGSFIGDGLIQPSIISMGVEYVNNKYGYFNFFDTYHRIELGQAMMSQRRHGVN